MVERLPPNTSLINSIRAERSSYHSWAGEAIDNALDAKARRVDLAINDKHLESIDDGVGITKARASAIVQISQHAEMGSTKLGRYGVGIKYKAVQHGNRLDVVSVSRDGKLLRWVDWRELLRIGEWDYPDPQWIEVADGVKSGTKVRISNLIGRLPRPADIEKTYSEIQRRYYPAIEDDVKIILNDRVVEALPMPLLVDPVTSTLSFPGGREARIRGGLLVDQNSKLRQVDLCVAFRVIKPDSDFGCDGYGGIRSMYARIDLFGPWQLTRFKDDIADDPYEDEFESAVEDVLRPVLEKCQSQSMFARHRELENILNEMLPENKRLVRPEKKNPQGRQGEKRGDKSEKNADGNADPTGPVKTKHPPRGFKIELVDHLCDKFGYGRAEISKKAVRIQLATDCQHIAELAKARDQRLGALALYAIAMLILEAEISSGKLEFEELGLRAWKIGQQQKIPDVV